MKFASLSSFCVALDIVVQLSWLVFFFGIDASSDIGRRGTIVLGLRELSKDTCHAEMRLVYNATNEPVTIAPNA